MVALPNLKIIPFPNPLEVEEDYEGLIAVGGNLHPNNILAAYKKGLFPWYSPGEPILWWSPDPRMVLFPEKVRKQSEVKKLINDNKYRIEINRDAEKVIRHCATQPRTDQDGTWINEDIVSSYTALAQQNQVWTIGLWENEQLLAGLYGVKMGNIFFGESMFTQIKNGSKACLVWLCTQFSQEIKLIDCQQETSHLKFMGAETMTRPDFLKQVRQLI